MKTNGRLTQRIKSGLTWGAIAFILTIALISFLPASWLFGYKSLTAVEPVTQQKLIMRSHSYGALGAAVTTRDSIWCGLSPETLVKQDSLMIDEFYRSRGEKVSDWLYRNDLNNGKYLLPYAPYCQVRSVVEYCVDGVPLCRRVHVESDAFSVQLDP